MIKKIILYRFQVIFWNETVRIKDNKKITFSSFKAIVSGKTLSFVRFKKVLYIQLIGILFNTELLTALLLKKVKFKLLRNTNLPKYRIGGKQGYRIRIKYQEFN